MVSPTLAANSYAALAKLAQNKAAAGATPPLPGAGGTSFGDMLKSTLTDLGRTTQATDTQMQGMATGKADVVDVVTAVAETEVAIEALVSIRDRVIQSYEEIMRMPI
jgi:flagellar hook-basal body complex protein FliE